MPSPFGVPGYVGIGGLKKEDYEKLLDLRSVHDVLNYHTHFKIEQKEEEKQDFLAQVCEKMKTVDLDEVFKVHCETKLKPPHPSPETVLKKAVACDSFRGLPHSLSAARGF